ncbi:MAG TPA: Zn-dependent hydrolase [Aminivibrio sp.]|uniref:Zn-dependent hydrolase n=1 Tax=Aminivibrio sp. TaxID=1872489 RepID=UPI002C43BEB0|nr:Zn-dependent hydrolase [Aminivibrio sp.]HPF84756.1 Zn-dependent hydrolase [Aminivibrio sp.]
MSLNVDISRLMSRLEILSGFNATPGKGITRFSYSPEDREARKYLEALFSSMGLKTTVDGAGNMRARLEGSDPGAPAVLSGSHIDTVLHGGKYDGAVGTLGAIEAVQAIMESGLPRRCPLEVAVFAEEEGSNFGSTLAGSKALVGKYTLAHMEKLKTPEGKSMAGLLREGGYAPESMADNLLRPETIKAMVELHIEQSVVLESRGVPVGIVEAVAGIRVLEIRIRGVPNHAGATPMTLRQDPLAAGARLMGTIEDLAKKSATGSTVATVGKILCRPNVSNIIPEEVTFTVDIRDVQDAGIESVAAGIEKAAEALAASRDVSVDVVHISESAPVLLDGHIAGVTETCARRRNFRYARMNSGAVHDACMFAPLVPTGMIFIPSKGGRSHVPEEFTGKEDIGKGVSLLADVLYELSK